MRFVLLRPSAMPLASTRATSCGAFPSKTGLVADDESRRLRVLGRAFLAGARSACLEDLATGLIVGHRGEPALGSQRVQLELAVGRRQRTLGVAFQLGLIRGQIPQRSPKKRKGQQTNEENYNGVYGDDFPAHGVVVSNCVAVTVGMAVWF